MSVLSRYPLTTRLLGPLAFELEQRFKREGGPDPFQFPLFLKQVLGGGNPDLVELAEWEGFRGRLSVDGPRIGGKKPAGQDRLMVSPFIRILRLRHNIPEWVQRNCEGLPNLEPLLLLVSWDPERKEIRELSLNENMAGILDELSEYSLTKSDFDEEDLIDLQHLIEAYALWPVKDP